MMVKEFYWFKKMRITKVDFGQVIQRNYSFHRKIVNNQSGDADRFPDIQPWDEEFCLEIFFNINCYWCKSSKKGNILEIEYFKRC